MASRRRTRALLASVLGVLCVAGWAASIIASQPTNSDAASAAASTASFTLAVVDDNANVPQGGTGAFTIAITRAKNFTSAVAFSVGGTPANATATFLPTSTTGNSVSLQVASTGSTTQGSYALTINGAAPGSIPQITTAHLTVSAPKGGGNKAFTISGSPIRSVAPGVSSPIDLSISNPNNQTLQVTALTATVVQTSKATCGTDNFSVSQFSGAYPLAVPANSTRSLSQLGVAPTQLPTLVFVNKPVNQDACKNVSVTLAYTGSGSGS
jgi:hypothetical protein